MILDRSERGGWIYGIGECRRRARKDRRTDGIMMGKESEQGLFAFLYLFDFDFDTHAFTS